MVANQDSGRIIDWIHSELKSRERGGLVQAEKDLGWTKGQIYNLKTIRDLKVSQFLDLCKILHRSPAAVLGAALEDPDYPCEPAPTGRQPAIVERVLSIAGSGVDDQLLKVLEETAKTAPQSTLDRLSAFAKELADDQKPLFLGICGSCYRKIYQYNEALHCLAAAKSLNCKQAVFGDILLRESLVMRDLGFVTVAIKKAEEAGQHLMLSKDLSAIARSITLQASYFLVLKDITKAKELYDCAKKYEPDMTDFTRAAYFHGRALCSLNDRSVAANLCRKALTEAKKCSSDELYGKTLWLYAVLRHSHRALMKAVAILSKGHPIDATLAAADLIELDGQLPDSAGKLVRLLFPIIENLSFLPDAQKAAERLLALLASKHIEGDFKAEIDRIRGEITESRNALLRASGSPKK